MRRTERIRVGRLLYSYCRKPFQTSADTLEFLHFAGDPAGSLQRYPAASAVGNGPHKAEPWKGRYKYNLAASDRSRRTQFRASVNSILGRRREWAADLSSKRRDESAGQRGCAASLYRPFRGLSQWDRSPTAEAVGYCCFVPDGTLRVLLLSCRRSPPTRPSPGRPRPSPGPRATRQGRCNDSLRLQGRVPGDPRNVETPDPGLTSRALRVCMKSCAMCRRNNPSSCLDVSPGSTLPAMPMGIAGCGFSPCAAPFRRSFRRFPSKRLARMGPSMRRAA